jgi:type II secretory pathway pseudopilin PulG
MTNRPRRHHYRRRFGMATLAVIVLLLVCVAATLVGFVVSRNRLSALADEQRRTEQQIKLYQQEIQALEKRIDIALTRDKVYQRLTAVGTHLRPIEPSTIISLAPIEGSAGQFVESIPTPSMAQVSPVSTPAR